MENQVLTKWDEYLIHQTADPVAKMAGDDDEWFDWLWLYACPKGESGPQIQAGYVIYPNHGTASGFALVNAGGRQYNFRGARLLSADRAETTLGPLSFEVVEPHKVWRMSLAQNDIVPVSFDVRFEGNEPTYLCRKVLGPPDRRSTTPQAWGHYAQGGHNGGWLKVGDETISLDGYLGLRDRSWGVRGQNMGVTLWVWLKAHLPGRQFFMIYQENEQGDLLFMDGSSYDERAGRMRSLKRADVKMQFEPITRELISSSMTLEDEDGATYPLLATPLSRGTYFRPAWGEQSWHEAVPFMEGETLPLDDETMRQYGKWLRQKHVRYESNGQIGYGLLEYAISGRHRVYGPMLRPSA